jgi:hypothetical protein
LLLLPICLPSSSVSCKGRTLPNLIKYMSTKETDFEQMSTGQMLANDDL